MNISWTSTDADYSIEKKSSGWGLLVVALHFGRKKFATNAASFVTAAELFPAQWSCRHLKALGWVM